MGAQQRRADRIRRDHLATERPSHRWLQFARILDLAEARGDLVVSVAPSCQFHIVADDPDDNKFTDCAITAGADYVITEDKHFSSLADAGYKPQPITPHEFIRRHLGSA